MSPLLSKRPLLFVALPALALLGACGTVNRGVESIHQPVVSRTDYVFDVGTSGAGLAEGETRRLAGWLESLRVGYGDQVAIDDPAGSSQVGGGSAAREDVARTVARYGLLVSDDAPVTAAPVAPGTLRVVVSRTVATVPHCPDFSRYRGPEFEGSTNSNHGCASNANLAAMVANPTDLVRGQVGSDVNDPQVGAKAIETYRKMIPTGAAGLKVEKAGSK